MPFGGIYTAADIAEDPHFEARNNIVTVPDEELGDIPMPGVSPNLTGTPGRVAHAGPPIGHHTDEILGEVLNLSSADIDALKASGVV